MYNIIVQCSKYAYIHMYTHKLKKEEDPSHGGHSRICSRIPAFNLACARTGRALTSPVLHPAIGPSRCLQTAEGIVLLFDITFPMRFGREDSLLEKLGAF